MSTQRSPILIPILLIISGILILLSRYLLIDQRIADLWPVVLILLGLQVLLRGDLSFSWQAHTFGITRGNVQSASLEVNSAEIDVQVRGLQRTGRLIAGQYTARSRPKLAVRHGHARLILNRGDTWLFSLADWNLELAPDLPWALLLSAHLGEIQADLRGLKISQAHIATGIGNVKVICPDNAASPIYISSTFGDIQVVIPPETPALIRLKTSPLANVTTRGAISQFQESPDIYMTSAYQEGASAMSITLSTTFGNIIMAAGN